MERISILGFVTSVMLIKNLKANTIENKENGITVIKRNLQPKYSTITPDRVGPMAGANIITSPTTPIIFPRLWGGYNNKKTLNIIGINSPVPIACINRPNNKIGKLGAIAQIEVPMVKMN